MQKVYVFNPSIKRKDMDSVLTCLVSDKIDSGDVTSQFVSKFCEIVSHSNGYAFREPAKGLSVLLKALNSEEGKKNIILSPLVPDFYQEAFSQANIEMRFCDVDIKTSLINDADVEKLIDENSIAIILFDTLGNINNVDDFRRFNLPIVQDISSTFGLTYQDATIGSDADWIFCSLEKGGMIVSGGGAIVTAKNKIGVGKLNKAFSNVSSESQMTNLNAALGLTQVATIADSIAKRKELYTVFKTAFFKSKNESIILSKKSEGFFYVFPVLSEVSAKEIVKYAKKYEIEVLFPFENSILNKFEEERKHYPNSLSLINRTVVFPLHPMIGKSSCDIICKLLSTLP